jgi:hypothetical protein
VISREARKYKWCYILEPRQDPVGKNAAGLTTALTFTEETPDTDLALAGFLDPALVCSMADEHQFPALPGRSQAGGAGIRTRFTNTRHRGPVFWRFEVVWWGFPADDSH